MFKYHNMPPLIEGEFLHSYFSRVAACNGMANLVEFMQIFMGENTSKNRARPVSAEYILLPAIESGSISASVAKLLYERGSTADLNSQVLQPVAGISATNCFFRKTDAHDFFSRRKTRSPNTLYFCPVCMEEDLREHGVSLLHTEHQLPGVIACSRHHVPLHAMTAGFNEYSPGNGFAGTPLTKITDVDILYAEYISAYFQKNYDISKEDITEWYIAKCNSLGIKTPDDLQIMLEDHGLTDCLLTNDMTSLNKDFVTRMRNLNIRDAIPLFMAFTDCNVEELPFRDNAGDDDTFREYAMSEGYEVVGEVHRYRPIVLRCLDCDYEYITTVSAFESGFRCPSCDLHRNKEEIIETIVQTAGRGEFELAGNISNIGAPIPIRHTICGATKNTLLYKFLSAETKCQCQRSLSQEDFEKRASSLSPDIRVTDPYVNSDTSISCTCRVCGHKWTTKAGYLISKNGLLCPEVSEHPGYINPKVMSEEEFLTRAGEASPDITITGKYTGSKEPIDCTCDICGHTWTETRSGKLLDGRLCPRYREHPGYVNPTLKTTSEFVKELRTVNPDILVIGEYQGRDERIHCKCKVCGHEWDPVAGRLLEGYGCPKIKSHDRWISSVKYTENVFIEKVREKSPDFEVTSSFIDMDTPVKVRCRICGQEEEVSPCLLTEGKKGCRNHRNHDGYIDPKQLTQQVFLERVSSVNPNIRVIGEYTGSSNRIDVECKICGSRFDRIAQSLMTEKTRCKNCQHNSFVERAGKKNPHIEIIGKYIAGHYNIDCKCRECGLIFSVYARRLLDSAVGCPNCNPKRKRYTHEQFIKTMKDMHPTIKILGTYVRRKDRIECECTVCGYQWNPYARALLDGRGCPKCKTQKE